MLAVILLSQHRVSSSKTFRLRAPYDARCIGHAIRTWSVVCSAAPHSQFGKGARPHLCMDKCNRPKPVRRELSLTQAHRDKLIPTGLALVLGIKAQSLEVISQYSAFHLWFVHLEARRASLARLFKRFCTADRNRRLDLSFFLGKHLRTRLEDHARYDQGPEINSKPRKMLLPVGEAKLAGCLRALVSGSLAWDAGIQ